MSSKKELQRQVDDQRLAILALIRVVERLTVGDKKWKGEERKLMLNSIDCARLVLDDASVVEPVVRDTIGKIEAALKDDPPLDKAIRGGAERIEMNEAIIAHVEGDRSSRFWIDLNNGDGYGTNSLENAQQAFRKGVARNVFDRSQNVFLAFNGMSEHPLLNEAA